ncbi:MAG: 30S ribosomal protein S15 [Candidatus Neomarinimicrobiota bacterium]|nr:MAG: 30S ribosomal protein S15 [Candidatus Neomarinimicrobiota bacterium]
MAVSKVLKRELIKKFGKNSKDTGSIQTQVAILTNRIKELTKHFNEHKKDHSSRRGLLKLVSKRRALLDYLKKRDFDAYKKLITELNIRK